MFAERPPSSQQRREDWPASGTVTDTSADERTVAGRMDRDMMSTTRAIIESLPRVSLATLPTPVTEAVGLRAALGGPSRCPRILLKRDDLTGLALGGNKARKLEFLIADARRLGATTIVTTGAVQSNHARMTAAAARVAGLEVTLVLTTREPDPPRQG